MARTKAKTKTPSAADLLDSLPSKSTTRKSTMPIVSLDTESHIKKMFRLLETTSALKAAKGARDVAEEDLMPIATAKFEKRCREDDQLYSSVKFVAEFKGDTKAARYTQKQKCRVMRAKDATKPLQRIFSDFDSLFSTQPTLTVDFSSLSEKQRISVIEAIQKVLGKGHEALGSEVFIVPKEAFYRGRILDPKIKKQTKKAVEQESLAIVEKASIVAA